MRFFLHCSFLFLLMSACSSVPGERGVDGGGSVPPDPLLSREAPAVRCQGEFQSALDARTPVIESQVLDVIQTIARDSGMADVRRVSPSALRWTTSLGDVVMIAGTRAVVVSRCPARNVGMIRRLDRSAWEFGRMLKAARPTTSDAELHTLACGERRYFTQRAGSYGQTRITTWVPGGHAMGTVAIPASTARRGFGVVMCAQGFMTAAHGPLRVDGQERFPRHSIGVDSRTGVLFEAADPGAVSDGAHSFVLDRWCPWWHPDGNGCGLGVDVATTWIEAFDEVADSTIAVSIGGVMQPVALSEEFSRLQLPVPL